MRWNLAFIASFNLMIMIEIVDIAPKKRTEPENPFGFLSFPEYPELQPDDVLFAHRSGVGSQGENANYVITYTGAVYRVSVFEFGSNEFMERVCPFLKDSDCNNIPDIDMLLNPDRRFVFKRYDWCRLGLWGANSLYMHSSMATDFANATNDFSDAEKTRKWLEIAVGLVEKMIENINPIKMKLMFENTDINRFIEAQETPYFCGYKQALEEIKNGRKINHWIWYIFPQHRCLGRSSRAHYYGIADRVEAKRYLNHTLLGRRIREITEALLEHKDKTALSIFGDIDAIKVRSCMTMFDFLSPNDIFGEVLRSFYNEERCEITLKVMQQE